MSTVRFMRGVLAVAIFLLIGFNIQAQTPDTASIRGSVVGSDGTAISGATVTAINEAIGLERSATTSNDGTFAIAQLPLTGNYHIKIEKEGFETKDQGPFGLTAGETARFHITLDPQAVNSEIDVYGTTEGVRSDSPQLGTRFDEEKIEETPILGRKLTNLPLLNSAVRPARGTGDLFLNNTLFVMNGGRRQTTFTIDGGDADDSWGRQTIFTNLPVASLQEMTVLTNAGTAEFGRTTAGVVNVVTKSGTNQFHGQVIGTFRPGGIQADAPVTGAEVHDELAQGTVVVGGPITNKSHFLISGEYSNQNRDSEVTSPLAPQVVTGDYHQSLFLAKADYQLNDANTLTGRFNLERFSDSNPQDVVGGNTLPSAGRVFRRNTYIGQVSDTTLFSESLFNEARFSVQYGSPITQFDPVDFSTQFVRPGVATEGESRSALLHNHQFQFANTLSWSRGNHFLKFGGDVVHSSSGGNSKEFGGPFLLGQFTFNPAIPATVPTSALTINDVTRYTQGFGNFDYENSEELYSIFAQDDFHLRENLVLNLGVRYDRQTFTDDSNNIAPRLGFAYNPGADQRTVIRGGYGIYYSEIPANFQADYSLGGPEGFFSFTASPGQLGFPTSLDPLPAFPPGAVLPPRNINVRPGDPGFYNQFFDVSALLNYPDKLLNPRTDMITLGGERQFGEWFLSVDGVHSHSQDIPWNLDLNAPTSFDRTNAGQVRSGTDADNTRPITPTPDGYRQIVVTTSLGEAKYDALQLNLRRPIGTKANMLLSYTWSHSRNNTEPDAPGGAPMDVRRLDDEWADSLLDQRHRVVVSGFYRLPAEFTAGGVFTAASGRPFNITTGVDNNGDGSNNDRPIVDGKLLGRNAGEGDAVYDITLFVEKGFDISQGMILFLRAEGYNLTNHANVVGYNSVFGNGAAPLPTFGVPLGGVANVEPGRQFQFQARLDF